MSTKLFHALKASAAMLLLVLSSCSPKKSEPTVRIVSPKAGDSYLVLPSGHELKLPVEFSHAQWRKLADEEHIPIGDGTTWFPSFQKDGQKILGFSQDESSLLRLKTVSGTGSALIGDTWSEGQAIVRELR